jgi:predicted nucleic acid-binding protein
VIYLDTSAILKLLQPELETPELSAHLAAHATEDLVTSALATVETARALTATGQDRLAAQAIPDSHRIDIGGATIAAIAMTPRVLDSARSLSPKVLRSLDAIHVGTATLLGPVLDHLITYDTRMASAAQAAGIRTASPS